MAISSQFVKNKQKGKNESESDRGEEESKRNTTITSATNKIINPSNDVIFVLTKDSFFSFVCVRQITKIYAVS